jgi:trehalose synthase
VQDVTIHPRPLATLAELLPTDQAERFHAAASRASEAMAGRVVWNINSTAAGGGVAEMLATTLGYLLTAGVQARWLVLDGDPDFFAMTKQLHNAIHGADDPPALDPDARGVYQRVMDRNLPDLLSVVGPRDVVLLHDPQSAGLLRPLQEAGARVAWRSHIGRDVPNERSVAAWEFLREYVGSADALVFSRRPHAPEWVPPDRLWVIPPSIDPLSPKNRSIPAGECVRVLTAAGLLSGDATGPGCRALVQGAPPPDPAARLVVQVSRWDRLKDMAGVMEGFARARPPADVHLMLVGPDVSEVSDDPEGAEVLAECVEAWRRLPEPVREHVSLVSVPMDDPVENATIVNAVQRHATVLTQKSLAEGFGLTVAEAMWKERPVVASAVGGIQDQVADGRDGLLISDPADLDEFAAALRRVLDDEDLAGRLGRAGQRRVLEEFLDDRHIAQYTALFDALLDGRRAGAHQQAARATSGG